MSKYYYKKKSGNKKKIILRSVSILLFLCGFFLMMYIFFPLVSWNIYFAPAFASANIEVPVPKTTLVTTQNLKSLVENSLNSLTTDYTDAQNWFPALKNKKSGPLKVSSYILSIPKLGIKNASVSTTDYNLDSHLIQYLGTSIPGERGTAVIFGHSTLPQLFNPQNYKAIFATVHTLQTGDIVSTTVEGITYTYKIFNISIVDPTETSMFEQDYNNSFLTLVTCTPPGTTWKRLIIKAKLEKV